MKILNRFTVLPVLLDFLEREKLVLLNPSTWADKNDTEIMKEYKKRKGLSSICALCFSYESETIHHWKTFSDGISGCVIEFDAKALMGIFDQNENVHYRVVTYKRMRDVSKDNIDVADIPFTKRWPYRYEKEFRVIWEGNSNSNIFEIDVPISCVKRVTISQQMPEKVYETIKCLLKKSFKNPSQKINRSTIYENKEWINKFKST